MEYRQYRGRHRSDYLQGMIKVLSVLFLVDIYTRTVYSVKVTRQAVPKFLPTPQNVTVHTGELANLVCRIHNLGPKMVVWRKWMDEHPLTVGEDTFTPSGEYTVDHEQISDKESKWNLLIKNVQPRHEGVYECQISAKGMYTRLISLKVINEPLQRKPQLSISGTEFVNQYGDIRLKCNATGMKRAPDGIDWFFDGNRIHMSNPRWYNRVEILNQRPVPGRTYISELIIHHSTVEDMGNYVCRSSDLNVNSIKVHILNAPRENPIVPRAPGEETRFAPEDGKYTNSVRSNRLSCTELWLFTVCLLSFLLSR